MKIQPLQSWSLMGQGCTKLIFWGGIVLCLLACGEGSNRLQIAVASNLLYPLEEVVAAFEKQSAYQVSISPAASGALSAQIQHGAPFDCFLSADASYPLALFQAGIGIAPPQTLIYGYPVFWSQQASPDIRRELLDLQVKKIAIANPDLAPYGQAARSWLTMHGLWDSVQIRLVYGNNIGQVNQYIYSGVVEAAFTAGSAQYASSLLGKGFWQPLPGATKIPHAMLVIREDHPALADWLNFLHTAEVEAIFLKYGYALNPSQ